MSLADWGRKEIDMAEHEMPGLMSIRAKYAPLQAAGRRARDRLAAHDHPDRGADRDAGTSAPTCAGPACNIFSTQDHAAAAIAAAGIPVFAWKGETLEEYWDCTLDAVTPGRQGPGAGRRRRRRRHPADPQGLRAGAGRHWVDSPGAHEEQVIKNLLKRTAKRAPGLLDQVVKRLARRLRGDHHRRAPPLPDDGAGKLLVPAINVNDSVTKSSSTTSTAAASRWPTASSAPPT
jgi:adenosylhomocysteinase